MEIKLFSKEHFKEISNIFDYYINEGKSTFRDKTPTCDEWIKGHVLNLTFVLIQNNTVIGFTGISKVSEREVYSGVGEVCIYIHPKFTNKGLGKLLLRYLVLQSEEKGFWTLNSNIFLNNEASIKLHKECGFNIVGVKKSLGKDIFGSWMDVMLMEKRSTNIF
ncbi:MAG: GNAT family N-acetyltransferase [Clostridium sp.]